MIASCKHDFVIIAEQIFSKVDYCPMIDRYIQIYHLKNELLFIHEKGIYTTIDVI